MTETAKMTPDEIKTRIEGAKDAVWGYNDPEWNLALEHLEGVPGSEEAVNHINNLRKIEGAAGESIFDEDIYGQDVVNLENSLDRLAESHGHFAPPNPEAPQSFLAHARQRMEGWEDEKLYTPYRNFLNDLEAHSVQTGKSIDQLMQEYMESPNENYLTGPVGKLLQKHDPTGEVADAFMEDMDHYHN